MWPALAAALLVGSGSSALASQPSRVVFTSARTGVAQLYSVSPSGGGLAQLTFGKTDWGAPVPSPDGRFVAALRNGWLFVMRPDGRDRRLLALNAQGVSWSADSRRIALQEGLGVVTVARQGGPRWPGRRTAACWRTRTSTASTSSLPPAVTRGCSSPGRRARSRGRPAATRSRSAAVTGRPSSRETAPSGRSWPRPG